MNNAELKKTSLSKLVKILVNNNIFPNQNVFYNCVFKMELRNDSDDSNCDDSYFFFFFLGEIKKSLSAANTKNTPIIDRQKPNNNEFALKFYKYAVGDFSGSAKISLKNMFAGKTRVDAANISNRINGKKPIEKRWLEKFENQTDRSKIRRTFCEPLSLIIQYLINLDMDHAELIVKKSDISHDKTENPWRTYIEFYTLRDSVQMQLKNDLIDANLYPQYIHKKGDSIRILDIAYIIYMAIQTQVLNDKEKLIKIVKSEKAPAKQRTLIDDYEFYINNVNCYGYKTSDRFNMLKRYASSNVYCANELGAIYYYGDVFYAVNDELIIEQDYEKAEHYYSLCIEEPLIVNNACWSLGYMVLHGKCPIIDAMNTDRYQYASELFKRCTPDYSPALNSLGLIELYYANDLRKNRKKAELGRNELEQLLHHYESFIDYSYRAAKNGFVNGCNAIAGFLLRNENEEFIPLIKTISNNNIKLIPLLKFSAEMDNVWALDQLANVYYSGKYNDSEIPHYVAIKKAKEFLERAYNQGYAWSAYHLAIYFSKKNSDDYWRLITEAAQKGCNEAIDILNNKSDLSVTVF